MTFTPRATEEICRSTVDGLTDQIMGLINPANDNTLAPWMMAVSKAQELVVVLQTVCDTISSRPMMNLGQQALRAIASERFTEVDFDDLIEAQAQKDAESRQMAEAEQISKAHCTVIDPIGDALGMVRPPQLTKEA